MGAVNITQARLVEIKKALQSRKIKPNHTENDHIFKIVAHKGNGSAGGIGVLKYAIEDLLKEMQCDYYGDLNHGVFLVRIKVKWIAKFLIALLLLNLFNCPQTNTKKKSLSQYTFLTRTVPRVPENTIKLQVNESHKSIIYFYTN